jgi:hypothetical protein
MLKVKCSDSVKLRGFIEEFCEQHFSTDGKILFCKLCEVQVTAGKCFSVQQHCYTIQHRNGLSQHFINQNRQWQLFKNTATPSSNNTLEFFKDLCERMVSANIPLHKANNQQFRNFLKKYTHQYIPTDSTLQKKLFIFLLPKCFTKNHTQSSQQQDTGIFWWNDGCWQQVCIKCGYWHTLCWPLKRT